MTFRTVSGFLVELGTLINGDSFTSRLGGVLEDKSGLTFITDCSLGLDITVGNFYLITRIVHKIEGIITF